MRIAFLGKGGSGKTSVAALYSTYLIEKGDQVMTIDADVNVHLGGTLGVKKSPQALADYHQELFHILEGENPFFKKLPFTPELGSIPPTPGSTLISFAESDPILQQFGVWEGSHVHLAVGKHEKVEVGGACYHYKLNALELFLHHLVENAEQFVVADTTAGVDNIGTSLFMAYDINIFCVEPTQKSVEVAKEFDNLIKNSEIPVFFIANKVEGEDDRKFLENHLPKERILGEIFYEEFFHRMEQGRAQEKLSSVVQKYTLLFDKITETLQTHRRNREDYLHLLRNIYQKECTSWWNSYHHYDLTGLLA